MKSRLFIGSSVESLAIANCVQELLEHDAEPVVWNQGIFGLSRYTLEALLSELDRSSFSTFIFAPDDLARIRGTEHRVTRDNVIFELGLFTGRLGKERTFIIQPRGADELHLPTDLLGLTPALYDANRSDRDIMAALGPACNKIRRAMSETISATDPSKITITTRGGADSMLGTPDQRLATQRELWVSGNDCKFIVESLSGTIKKFLGRGGLVKVICTQPSSEISQMLALVDPRFDTPEHFQSSMAAVLYELGALKRAHQEQFEYRLLPFLPSVGFFITDRGEPQGIVKAEIYSCKPFEPIATRPHLILSITDGAWREYFIQQWNNYWLNAKPHFY